MSTTTPTQTSRKNARIADDVDRISDLPDGVISHILSNLPIKDAVRTSVLSKYWEFKWTSIYNMHIQHVAWREIFCDPQAAGILGELGSRVRKFLRRVSSVQNLRLTNDVLKAMVQSKASLSLPRYSELKRLNVCSPIELDVDGLLEILHASPYLEFLFIIMNDGVDEYNYEAIESVPSCILSHLKQITFCYFSWSCKNPQFHLEKFLLKNASELKNVYVTGDSGCNGLQLEKFVNQLSALPKGSNCLKVEAKVHCRQLLNA